ncbi:MAG: uncharacterized protein A8A55_0904 [Amphiamblys sp. WSBS2006]|nr:MAG: uncharacterized protein A8A55_0904 [Amphiamblys sp. WSBS2006]
MKREDTGSTDDTESIEECMPRDESKKEKKKTVFKPVPAVMPNFRACRITMLSSVVEQKKGQYMETEIDQSILPKLKKNKFLGVYMDPPFKCEDEAARITLEEFEGIRIADIVSHGMFFIWTEKEMLEEIVDIVCGKWGLRYVENICWLKKNWDNSLHLTESRLFSTSKKTLLVFRKSGDLDLRHQRSPDTIIDFIKPHDGRHPNEEKPGIVYEIIETMLPDIKKGTAPKFLELWARKDSVRDGWMMVYDSTYNPKPAPLSDDNERGFYFNIMRRKNTAVLQGEGGGERRRGRR